MSGFNIRYPYDVKYIDIHDHIQIAYTDVGEGKTTLLFIHGLANYFPVWKYQLDELSKYYRCVAIDLPGNGLSSSGNYPYSMFFYAECVKRFVDELNLTDVILTGHSMGGQISLVAALRYPHLFRKLVLVAPAGIEYFHPHERMLMQPLLSMGDFFGSDEMHLDQAIRESFFAPYQGMEHMINEMKAIVRKHPKGQWRKMAVASVNGMLNEQLQQYLPELSQEVLMIFGQNDQLIPNKLIHGGETTQSIANKGAALIPNCELYMLPQAGHFVMIEQYQLVNERIKSFIQQHI